MGSVVGTPGIHNGGGGGVFTTFGFGGSVLVTIGVLIGVPAALAAARFASSRISGLLYGISATDPVTIALAASLLIAVAAIASYFPARRASLVDPMVALRNE